MRCSGNVDGGEANCIRLCGVTVAGKHLGFGNKTSDHVLADAECDYNKMNSLCPFL